LRQFVPEYDGGWEETVLVDGGSSSDLTETLIVTSGGIGISERRIWRYINKVVCDLV